MKRWEKIQALQSMMRDLYDSCKHELRPLTEKEKKDELGCGYAVCLDCRSRFGWRCSESPDTVCHYFTDDKGLVELIDGREATATEGDYEHQSSDRCLFCGLPEERK